MCPSEDSDSGKNPKNYAKRVQAVFATPIPSSPDWNQRFREALKSNGLTLSTSVREEEKSLYPSGYPVIAPLSLPRDKLDNNPHGYLERWPRGSFIIYDESA
jgi:hypothetical protein